MRGNKPYLTCFFLPFLSVFFVGPIVYGQAIDEKAVTMDQKVKTYLKTGGYNESHSKITRYQKWVRQEPIPKGDEFHIYDYQKLIFYRIFPKDQIFFSHTLNPKEVTRAYRQGILPNLQTSSTPLQKIKLRNSIFNGLPVTLFIIGGKIPGKSKPAYHYSFLWESQEEPHFPLRMADTHRDGSTMIIEYLNIQQKEVDLSLFKPPNHYLHLNPY